MSLTKRDEAEEKKANNTSAPVEECTRCGASAEEIYIWGNGLCDDCRNDN